MTPRKELQPPHLLAAFDVPRFEVWLGAAGATLLEHATQWEVCRYRWMGSVSIVYRNKTGRLRYVGQSWAHYETMLRNKSLTINGKGRVRLKASRRLDLRERLLQRDGAKCWLTGAPMSFTDPKAPDFCTIEHLWPASAGGPNVLTNLVLVTRDANDRIGRMSLVDKIKLRDELRNKRIFPLIDFKPTLIVDQ